MGQCLSQPVAVGKKVEDPQEAVDGATEGAGLSCEAWHYRGAARPPGEERRLQLLHSLGVLDGEKEDRFEAITTLLCSIFNVPISLISLVDAERQWFLSVTGLQGICQTGREESFCAWTLLPESPHVLIVEDAAEDARFRENPLVQGPPYLRFYAGAPLVSSVSSYRYGSVCVADTKPHVGEFTAEQYNLLAQFAELTVRAIEGSKLATLQRMVQQEHMRGQVVPFMPSLPGNLMPPGEEASRPEAGLTRAADCFLEGVLLVDASSPGWRVLYTNEAFTSAADVPRDEATGEGFWDMFHAPNTGPASYAAAVAANEPFSVVVGLQEIYSHSPTTMVVDFRPAATGHISSSSNLIGIPSDVLSTEMSAAAAAAAVPADAQLQAQPPGPHYYFGILRPRSAAQDRVQPTDSLARVSTGSRKSGRRTSSGHGGSLERTLSNGRSSFNTQPSDTVLPTASMVAIPSFKRAMPSAFTDVRLGPLIGRGAYGRVYRGSWNGNTVAVKVIETADPAACAAAGICFDGPGTLARSAVFEAVLSSNLSHPNIVHTYQYAVRPMEPPGSEAAPPAPASNPGSKQPSNMCVIWLISEFCNRGPLLTAVERGAFLTQPSSQYGQPNLIAVLQTLQEIAAALQYLHSHDVLHGDLTGGNVLLTASDKDTRGFVCKVADFGLSRVCSDDYLRTRTLGCAEYMPPELITDGVLTKAADVYAFGVITWEIYVGRRAWEGLKPTEVLKRVASRTRLEFPAQTPHRLKVLGERCMEYDPCLRPTFSEVLQEVNSILNDTMGILQQFLAASTAGAGGTAPAGPAVASPAAPDASEGESAPAVGTGA